MSARAPLASPSRKTGNVEAAWTSATSSGSSLIDVISQAAVASFIHMHRFAVSQALQSMRKTGWRSGVQAEPGTVLDDGGAEDDNKTADSFARLRHVGTVYASTAIQPGTGCSDPCMPRRRADSACHGYGRTIGVRAGGGKGAFAAYGGLRRHLQGAIRQAPAID
ncbi:hypothetical protein GCM10011348_44100 [Marinobacterium nitratireducens]|uniref:Uncharacterized protein n=1 Tax=Marinobacterium nitratireducens TaxID=518897 RepID=A0A918DXG0_9GAMM|nr:hypothetical protein GCM10011348_44100 [Marinobacterium nitratireducens]